MTARLHLERIARGDPARWLALTHGIYGAGSNWRGIARKLTERRPEWGVLLIDLRQHGRSEPGAPPHTLRACAEDVRAAIAGLAVGAIAGHSFGGKVVLALRGLVELPVDQPQIWVLDASPSARPGAIDDPSNSSARVLALMERLPKRWARREEFVAAVVAEGHSLALAQWLAMNVVPDDRRPGAGELALRLDLPALRALLTDFHATDLWSELERPGPPIEVVVATRSSAVSEADRARLAAPPPHVHVHAIDADHWLHIEAPAAVIELFAVRLP